MDNGKIKSHIHELEIKHRRADEQVTTLETSHADPDDIHYFKKKRLALRDQIAKYTAMLG